MFYFGFNIGVQSIYYRTTESYSESAATTFANGFNSFAREYRLTTNGTGVNLKAGFIFTPPGGFRIGASISTPTWFYMNEEWEENINAQFTDGYNQTLYSPLGTYEYKLNTPFVYNIGIAYTLKPFFTVSADYQYVDIPGSKFKTTDNSYDEVFDLANKEMKNFNGQNVFRAGVEGIINPYLSVRAGYQYYSKATDNSAYSGIGDFERQYVSGGLGFNLADGFFIDFSYIQRLKGNKESFNLYSSNSITSPEGTNKMNSWQFLLSIGMRF
jgi:Long-chain fatty acid transport protein